MIAVFAAVKNDDGKIHAESFLLTEEEAADLQDTATDTYRPWMWTVWQGGSLSNAHPYSMNNHYARWWWGEWERRRQGLEKQEYVPDATEWHNQREPRCPWCDKRNEWLEDPQTTEARVLCNYCQQPFIVEVIPAFNTKPHRNE